MLCVRQKSEINWPRHFRQPIMRIIRKEELIACWGYDNFRHCQPFSEHVRIMSLSGLIKCRIVQVGKYTFAKVVLHKKTLYDLTKFHMYLHCETPATISTPMMMEVFDHIVKTEYSWRNKLILGCLASPEPLVSTKNWQPSLIRWPRSTAAVNQVVHPRLEPPVIAHRFKFVFLSRQTF